MLPIMFLVLMAVVWADLHLFRAHANATRSPADTAQGVAQRPAAVPSISTPTASAPVPATNALHVQLPDVSHSALRTIHGHIRITVLVVVDRSGTVIDAHLKNTGPSSYFARLAREAARKWTFAPAAAAGARRWLLRFEFTHDGITSVATPGT